MKKLIKEFKNIKLNKQNQTRQVKTYCQRCGRNVGKNFKHKKINLWKGFFLCPLCFKDKKQNIRIPKMDLEDLIENNIKI